MRTSILWALLSCIVFAGLSLSMPAAHACSPVYVSIGFWSPSDTPLQNIPINGGWAAIGRYGTNETSQDPAFDMRVLNEDDEPVDGRFNLIPYGYKSNPYGETYEQAALVTWTPNQDLQPNHHYRVLFASRPTDEERPDEAYHEQGSFFTGDETHRVNADQSLAIANSQAEYVDTPAYDRKCVEKEPCPSSCGCQTFRWSTRYYRIPTIALTVRQQGDDPNTQFYHVIEDEKGAIRDLLWSDTKQINTIIKLDHGDEAPLKLTIHTYAIGNDAPIATVEHTINADDLPPLEGTDFEAESQPKKCRNRSAVIVHNDGYQAPPAGCFTTSTTSNSSLFFTSILCLLLLFRPRKRSNPHSV